jgi:hypothetical protein
LIHACAHIVVVLFNRRQIRWSQFSLSSLVC